MRFIYQGVAKDGNGMVIQGATVTVYEAGTTTLADVYSASSGGAAINSVDTSSIDGSFSFWVDTEDYSDDTTFKIIISESNFASKTFDNLHILKTVSGEQLTIDPLDPPDGKWVMWQSEGTGSGDDGDIMIKITDAGGTTKTATLVDYSGV